MSRYDSLRELGLIDANKWGIVLLSGAALIGNYVWFIEGLRVGYRDRVCSLPIFCTLFWFAHDASFVVRFDKWFHTYHHWYVELMWLGLAVNVVMELLYLRQAFRYGHAEFAPRLSQRAFGVAMAKSPTARVPNWSSDNCFAAGQGKRETHLAELMCRRQTRDTGTDDRNPAATIAVPHEVAAHLGLISGPTVPAIGLTAYRSDDR